MTPPPALRSRLLARVHAEVAGEERSRPRSAPLRERLWRTLPAGRGLTAMGAVAAMAAVVLAVWSFAIPHRQASPPGVLVSRACGLTPLPSACGELSYTPATHQSVLTVQGLPPLPVANSVNARSSTSSHCAAVRRPRSMISRRLSGSSCPP